MKAIFTAGRFPRVALIVRRVEPIGCEAMAAMRADRNSSLVALIIQDIIKDAVDQTIKKGRSMQSPTVLGYLAQISESLAAAR